MNLWNRNRLKTNLWLCCVRCAKSFQLCPTLCDPMDSSLQVPLSSEFSRKEYLSGLPFPTPGDWERWDMDILGIWD